MGMVTEHRGTLCSVSEVWNRPAAYLQGKNEDPTCQSQRQAGELNSDAMLAVVVFLHPVFVQILRSSILVGGSA